MAVNPTTNLKIVRVQSEHVDNKVATLNDAQVDIDAALGGMLILDVSASVDITLTRSQALNKRLKFIGVLTASITIYIPVIANLALSPPTTTVGALRDYLIWNATTGAFTITIKTSAVASAGVTITQTKEVYIAHDGSTVKKVTTEV